MKTTSRKTLTRWLQWTAFAASLASMLLLVGAIMGVNPIDLMDRGVASLRPAAQSVNVGVTTNSYGQQITFTQADAYQTVFNPSFMAH